MNTYTDCISGATIGLLLSDGTISGIVETKTKQQDLHFIGPGLIDLQVNGINGIDFNDPSLTMQQVTDATHYLLSQGVTTYLPTVITNSEENTSAIVSTIYNACSSDNLVNDCIWGIHLEGPFLSSVPGAKGAHDERFLKLPDWSLFQRLQEAAGGKIRLMTIAPELPGAFDFIRQCTAEKVLVSIGHSMAERNQIDLAVEAGATMSTHLGNAVPLLLPRHPNIIWDLLATEQLYVCIIADGLHLPDSFIKVVMKTKKGSTFLVSDATRFAGMPAGEYENHIGGQVILDSEKRVNLKSTPGLLAGAAKSLLENVETLMAHGLADIAEAWAMASSDISTMLAKYDSRFELKNDLVIFEKRDNRIQVEKVIKSGKVVFNK
jgi:N-acetylglucosamine-6-phosphate deacetylase